MVFKPKFGPAYGVGIGVAVGGTEVAVGSGTAVAVGAVVAVETGADVAGAEAVSPPPHAIIPNSVALSVITRSFLSSCIFLSFSSTRTYYADGRFYHNAADNDYKKDLIDTEILDFTLEDITKVALTF